MIDAKTILDQFLGSKVPGTENSVSQTAQKAGQLAKDNPVATGLLAAVLLGTGPGRLGTSAHPRPPHRRNPTLSHSAYSQPLS